MQQATDRSTALESPRNRHSDVTLGSQIEVRYTFTDIVMKSESHQKLPYAEYLVHDHCQCPQQQQYPQQQQCPQQQHYPQQYIHCHFTCTCHQPPQLPHHQQRSHVCPQQDQHHLQPQYPQLHCHRKHHQNPQLPQQHRHLLSQLPLQHQHIQLQPTKNSHLQPHCLPVPTLLMLSRLLPRPLSLSSSELFSCSLLLLLLLLLPTTRALHCSSPSGSVEGRIGKHTSSHGLSFVVTQSRVG